MPHESHHLRSLTVLVLIAWLWPGPPVGPGAAWAAEKTNKNETVEVDPASPAAAEAPFVVIVDPGHGGSEAGCTGAKGTIEKRLVLDVSLKIAKLLMELPGIKVIVTRDRDRHVPLWDRVDLANRHGADLFISVHVNAFVRPSFGGVETFFHSVDASDDEARRVAQAENAPSQREGGAPPDALGSILADMQRAETLRDSSRFAHLIQAQLAGILPFDNLGVKQADFVVLRGTNMPAVLLELGFLTNRQEEKILKQEKTQDRIAQAVRLAVIEFKHLMQRKLVQPDSGRLEPSGRPGP